MVDHWDYPRGAPECFTSRLLPLYHGPLVTIKLKPSNLEYKVSKDLLCAESTVFAAMFGGHFLESQTMEVELEELENVVTPRSVQALIQWIYLRGIKFDLDVQDKITAAMEFARLADMYAITELEYKLEKYMKDHIFEWSQPGMNWEGLLDEDEIPKDKTAYVERNTVCLKAEHIISATHLHRGHPVRRLLAGACVKGLLQDGRGKFSELIHEYPSFGADLLIELRAALCSGNFEDPISHKALQFGFHGHLTVSSDGSSAW
ncbi:hypothetical protein N7528_004974 [Penicillium herquei]|nr:hypothetical protein N7528_004974 [Penicillium herquei]